MAYTPIERTVPQYVDGNGAPYSGAVLKAYTAGTSTNISFSTNSAGSILAATISLNASGYPTVSGNVVIPHLDRTYKLALYPNQAAADANTGAIWTVDNIQLFYYDMGSNEITSIANGTARSSAINVGQVQDSQFLDLGTTGGSADAYTASPSVAITAYAATQFFIAKIHATNATTTPYLQISSITSPASNAVIKKLDSAKSEIAVEAGDMIASGVYMFKRNSGNTAWIIMNPEKPGSFKVSSGSTLTIASGVVTITNTDHALDTESAAATDDLDTISGGVKGQIIVIHNTNSARVITVKNGTGNIVLDADYILTDPNDRLMLQHNGTNWIRLVWEKLVKLSSSTPSSAATVDFTNLSSTKYVAYKVVLKNVIPATNATYLLLRFSTDNGSSYVAGSNYRWSTYCVAADGASAIDYSASEQSGIVISALDGGFQLSSSYDGYSGEVHLGTIAGKRTSANAHGNYINSGGPVGAQVIAAGYYDSGTTVNAIRFLFSSGNIASGNITLYGLKA